ncbi:DoxX family membrane protein [Bdellovibrio bacteriovorus]|uniref:DoxX family membrane protein n=1 Tax=Bdellovibrio TaxID=958 RepID=UPI0035A8AFDE
MNYYIEIIFRWAFGLQMVFWGLNGFFHWIKIPPSGAVIDKFVEACVETKFIMPSVKLIEIFCGAFLLLGFAIPISLVIFAPLMFVITGLHLFHNPKHWTVLAPVTIPYLVLLVFHSGSLLRLIH